MVDYFKSSSGGYSAASRCGNKGMASVYMADDWFVVKCFWRQRVYFVSMPCWGAVVRTN